MKFILIILTAVFANLLIDKETIIENVDDLQGDIIVSVENIQQEKGSIYVGLFNSKRTFRKIKKVYKFKQAEASSSELILTLENVPFREYAIVVYQDYNKNKKFDKSFMGIPKEPFGFSTNYKVSTRAPKYKDVLFDHGSDTTSLKIDLQYY